MGIWCLKGHGNETAQATGADFWRRKWRHNKTNHWHNAADRSPTSDWNHWVATFKVWRHVSTVSCKAVDSNAATADPVDGSTLYQPREQLFPLSGDPEVGLVDDSDVAVLQWHVREYYKQINDKISIGRHRQRWESDYPVSMRGRCYTCPTTLRVCLSCSDNRTMWLMDRTPSVSTVIYWRCMSKMGKTCRKLRSSTHTLRCLNAWCWWNSSGGIASIAVSSFWSCYIDFKQRALHEFVYRQL